MRTIKLISFLSILLLIGCKQNDSITYFVDGVSNPVINLNGIWKVNINPPEESWQLIELNSDWKDIQVPGELMMQGFPIKHDVPFVYKTSIDIPADYKEKTVMLQFDGVYSYVRIWINGNYVCEHSGGFTRWECDITSFVNPGETAILTLEATDKADEISYASGYAKHQIGGILGDVNLLALPVNYPEDITIKTDFDDNYNNASLIISGDIKSNSSDSKIAIGLFDMNNENINLENTFIVIKNEQTFEITNQINNPKKWDAEHPNLYSLKISFSENDKLLWQKMYKVGFRKIVVKGNKLLVNGYEVKLRGACRHNIHPLLGRVSTSDYELKDVLLAKEANMNFIRTSHYPPTENFLQLCDEYGLYVEDETAVCFVGSHRTKEYYPGASESDSMFTKRYLSQLQEMVNNHKNHPSIIMWSIGNENSFGSNFKKSYDWVKANDDTRPVIFSYPGLVPNSIKAYDIISMHYPGTQGNMNQYGIKTKSFGNMELPVIFDEWAHVACYNNFTIKEDPNIRDFWGRSLDTMWQRTFDADGGLGGAIWGMIDETFMLPDSLPGFNEWWGRIDEHVIPAEYSGNTIGYGEWGIIDTWRRKKPEFWNTKKAYSPVKLLKTEIENYSKGSSVSIPIYNRFDHTNINELIIKTNYKKTEKILTSPNIKPHTKGNLIIPMEQWDSDEAIIVEFLNQKNSIIDKYSICLKAEPIKGEDIDVAESITIEDADGQLIVICENNTKVIFNKKTGLISQIQNSHNTIGLSGPHLNLRTKGESVIYSYHQINDYCKNWALKHFEYKQAGKQAIILIDGEYDNSFPVEFKLTINSNGKIAVQYQVENIPQENIREMGIKFEMEDIFDSVSWIRYPYWSFYPGGHLSAAKGKVALYPIILKTYRTEPKKDWTMDCKSFYYNGTANEVAGDQLSNSAKATKENIIEYSIINENQEILSVNSNGELSCRIAKEKDKIYLFINNEMDYIDLSWGNYQRDILLDKSYSNNITLTFNAD